MKPRAHYICLLLLLAFVLRVDATTDDWDTDLPKVLIASKEADRPVLVYFTASWCGPCKLMKRTTLSDAKVTERLESFSKVLLDFDKNPELAKKFGIQGIPAFLVVSSSGDPIAKNIGYMDVPQFETWLTDGLAASAFAAGQQKVFDENVAKLEKVLKSSTQEERVKAINQLFDFCGSSERADREYGAKKIKELGEAEPLILLNGLNHQKLAVRIEVSKLLHQKLGDKFQFDPWLSQRERSIAAEKVKAQFSEAK